MNNLEESGHDVELVVSALEKVLHMLEEGILNTKTRSNKVEGIKWSSADKFKFIEEWRVKNKIMINDSGIEPSVPEEVMPRFVSGIMLSISPANYSVSLLQIGAVDPQIPRD
jgi:hypothetical protein